MIVGLGLDIVEILRIQHSLQRFGLRFMEKILHKSETFFFSNQEEVASLKNASHVAARFAAKEAGSKALGTGFSGGVNPVDIRVLSQPSGKPELFFHGKALEQAQRLGVDFVHLSLTHSRLTAGAVVVLESASENTHYIR